MRHFRMLIRILEWTDRLLTGVLLVSGTLLLLYAMYALYDNYAVSHEAGLRKKLLRYKPVEEEETWSFDELQRLNPDVKGWITIEGTRIDYPVAQGRNDLEYADKDILGNASITGSIYLSSKNAADFSDAYSILYGHHLDSGAMFGDLDLFLDPDFFETHPSGQLVTPHGNYVLKFFAVVLTDAYELTVFDLSQATDGIDSNLRAYIADHAVHIRQTVSGQGDRILALSTCYQATTNGRLVLFASVTEAEHHANREEAITD